MLWMALLLGATISGQAESAPTKYRVYVGTYTNERSKGIYLCEFDTETGTLTPKGLAAESDSPSFLSIHPSKKFLYTVNELNASEGRKAGAVTAFSIDPKTGKLTQLNRQSSGGNGPCHLSDVREGKVVLVANYGSGSVTALPVNADGSLSPNEEVIEHKGSSVNRSRQMEPHAHSANIDRSGKFAIVADLGLDKVFVYDLDVTKAKLKPHDPAFTSVKAGSGPRHFAFHPNNKHAYVINELSSTVTAFDWDSAKGTLAEIQTITTIPPEFQGKSFTAEVVVHPSGKFLYGSNRGHNSIAVFQIDQASGKLTAQGQVSTAGKTPRNFVVDPSGKFLLAENQDSDTITVLKINQETGALTQVGDPANVPVPVCIKFVPID